MSAAHDDTGDNLTAGERKLRDLLRFWTLLFAAGAVSFGADPDRSTGTLNLLPGPSLPPSTEKYWNALAVSLMATLTTLTAIAASDVRKRRGFVLPVLVSKAVSSGMYVTRFRSERKTPYLVGAVVDGSIFVVTLKRFAAASRR